MIVQTSQKRWRQRIVEPAVQHPRFAAHIPLAFTVVLLGTLMVGDSFSARSPEVVLLPDRPVALRTAILNPPVFSGAKGDATRAEVLATGASAARLSLDWSTVAPETVPPRFAATKPDDPAYDWHAFDKQLRAVKQGGLEPIVDIANAPSWATAAEVRGGPYKPDPAKLAAFAKAVATRYDGSFGSLPRVRYWQLWNEPNLALYLQPQFLGPTLYSPGWYRRMVNAFADAVHAVHADNVVIAGGTAPFTTRAGKRSVWGPGPLPFLRTLLCLSKKLEPTCDAKVHFDVWAHHPYTSGGANHHAASADDVSVADLPKMKAVLDAGIRTGHIVSQGPLRFWVTEFSWDSNPPDRNAMPIALQTRWVAEALYKMWTSGVSLVTWFLLKDLPVATSPYQSGLYFRSGQPKPALRAFRFPFVAIPATDGIHIWGRTSTSKRAKVVIEQRSGRAWQRLGSVNANAFGIFTGRVEPEGTGPLRARLSGSETNVSRPFSLREPPDFPVRPFGES